MTENKEERPMLIASFSAVFGARGAGIRYETRDSEARSKGRAQAGLPMLACANHWSRSTKHESEFTHDNSLPVFLLQLILQQIFYQRLHTLREQFLQMRPQLFHHLTDHIVHRLGIVGARGWLLGILRRQHWRHQERNLRKRFAI